LTHSIKAPREFFVQLRNRFGDDLHPLFEAFAPNVEMPTHLADTRIEQRFQSVFVHRPGFYYDPPPIRPAELFWTRVQSLRILARFERGHTFLEKRSCPK
jgi:hypothetical protein